VKTKYTRQSPSPRYRRLLEEYRIMHVEGEKFLGIPPERTFPGSSLAPQAAHIKRLIKRTGARSLLDYGSGKGRQYELRRVADPDEGLEYPDFKSYWGIEELRLYDPGYARYNELPEGTFDGVISTDVLEHCPEEDIPWILEEMIGYARKFVFANVACFPAKKRLPSGGNAHCTIKPARWWQEEIERAVRARPGLVYEFRLAYLNGQELEESVIAA
jgi:hypothetical protein